MPQKADKIFSFPPSTLFRAWSKDEGLAQVPLYRQALYEHGVAKIQCEFGGNMEEKSELLLEIVNALGKADSHSATEGALWDIKNKPEGVISQGTGQKAIAISHTLDEFSWHIDGSFEEKPTRFFAFHIIHPDKQGGGVFRLLPVADIVNSLPDDITEILATKDFNIKVPPEFFKGAHTLRKPLLERPANGPALIRYRKGVCSADEHDVVAQKAIRVLENLLQAEDTGFAVPAEHFKEDTLLLLDNRRFLHSRTSIRDPNRWLRRVRFHADSAAA
ncbi:Clavaminate synthase-like protein [Neolentinus lepideus HHB14362 ss-1]|uniref:Clavaminate synthase-like protein n=1 Tax=Neolentinus lepideus HHB14362 ss-1 TaxID=1314782 RepID=A0A165RGR4_9AGAM|nr:Clavaminate synthase-like protein [Neolentinus lepideus HHB14362 ss-1]